MAAAATALGDIPVESLKRSAIQPLLPQILTRLAAPVGSLLLRAVAVEPAGEILLLLVRLERDSVLLYLLPRHTYGSILANASHGILELAVEVVAAALGGGLYDLDGIRQRVGGCHDSRHEVLRVQQCGIRPQGHLGGMHHGDVLASQVLLGIGGSDTDLALP